MGFNVVGQLLSRIVLFFSSHTRRICCNRKMVFHKNFRPLITIKNYIARKIVLRSCLFLFLLLSKDYYHGIIVSLCVKI